MASIQRLPGGWRAQIAIKGVRDSKTFSTKAEAQSWASERETEIRKTVQTGIVFGKTVQDVFDRYEKEVSEHKAGKRWESIRLAALARFPLNRGNMGKLLLSEITPEVLGEWRDKRMTGENKVSGSTVNREIKLLSHVFTIARREWRWIAENPIKDMRRPKESRHRNRLISQDEINRICLALGFNESPVATKSGAVAIAFLFAIETAMRAGEICGLTTENIKGSVAHLAKTKNGDERAVPLSKRAIDLLKFLPEGDTLFGVSASSLDALFRKARDRCEIKELHFHDTRHEAITRLAKKIGVLDLARMVGHKNLNQLQIYYNESAHNIAKLLG